MKNNDISERIDDINLSQTIKLSDLLRIDLGLELTFTFVFNYLS